MTVTLRGPSPHMVTPTRDVVEVWRDGEFIASVYPTENGVRVVSKHGLTTTRADDDTTGIEAVNVHVGAA